MPRAFYVNKMTINVTIMGQLFALVPNFGQELFDRRVIQNQNNSFFVFALLEISKIKILVPWSHGGSLSLKAHDKINLKSWT